MHGAMNVKPELNFPQTLGFCLPLLLDSKHWNRTHHNENVVPHRLETRLLVTTIAHRRFPAPVQTGPGAHPASYTMDTGSFPGVKAAGE
jgi:hypothetical protein